MTFHVERIDHVVLRVRDLPAMVKFYEQALGFKVERTLERLSLVQMRAGASMLDLVKGERPAEGGNMDHLCLRIEPCSQSMNIQSKPAAFMILMMSTLRTRRMPQPIASSPFLSRALAALIV